MQIGMIGLGRMGMKMARRLLGGRHKVVAYNRTQDKVEQIASEGAVGASSIEDLLGKLRRPRVVWMMLPVGGIVDEHIEALSKRDVLKTVLDKPDDAGKSYPAALVKPDGRVIWFVDEK